MGLLRHALECEYTLVCNIAEEDRSISNTLVSDTVLMLMLHHRNLLVVIETEVTLMIN